MQTILREPPLAELFGRARKGYLGTLERVPSTIESGVTTTHLKAMLKPIKHPYDDPIMIKLQEANYELTKYYLDKVVWWI